MIRAEQVSFTYENAINGAAITDMNAQISKGQVVLLCGESGSGKTTFGRLVNGLIPSKENRHGGILLVPPCPQKKATLTHLPLSYFLKRKTAALKFSDFKTAA